MRKYELLAKELGLIYNCEVLIIPYVLTWDGIVTGYHEKYKKMIGIEDHLEAYIQSLVLKKTFESVLLDCRPVGAASYTDRKQKLEMAEHRVLMEAVVA